jgi:UDP-galactopyranose mutase
MTMNADVLIVGAGLSGATMAEHFARCTSRHVTVIDKRSHIGGNVYDSIDETTGIRIGNYGVHMFHTNDAGVWDYVQRFGRWARCDHKVLAKVGSQFVPVPVNINTVNTLCNETLQTQTDMEEWLRTHQVPCENPATSEDVALSRVGPRLYSMLFRPYTRKQWNKDPSELAPSVLARIPVRSSFDDRYFDDKYQALPVDGYTAIVEAMLDHPRITVRLNTSWESVCDTATYKTLIFTGPIDQYFKDRGLPPLEYRSLQFAWEVHKTPGYYQPATQVNYPGDDVPYTRIVEYKHLLGQTSEYTILSKETSSSEGEPYYPVPTATNQAIYEKYRDLAGSLQDVHFLGRLATYKYFNMDQAIRCAMDYFHNTFCA